MGRNVQRLRANQLQGGRLIQSDINYAMENHNCNKRSMTLNLSLERGQKILHKMLETADVLVSNYRPRELKKFNLEWDTLSKLNPRLIHANVTGYGIKGPDSDLPGYDFNTFWTRSGVLRVLMTPDMEPPSTPIALGDRVTTLAFAYGIMTTLFIRERTGRGQQVHASLLQTAMFVNATDVGAALITGEDRQNVERKDLANALLNSYPTKDGRWLRLAINQPDLYWSRFCRAIKREDLEHDPKFESFEPRIENHLALFNIVEKTFLTKTLAEWKVHLDKAGLPWAPVSTLPEVVADPQARANDFFIAYDHPTYGRIEILNNPTQLSNAPSTVRMPAPEFGQHTEEVLLEYGYTWDDIAQFKEEGIIA